MADQPPIVPPFRKPVSLFKTPDQTIVFVTELVNRDDPAYVQNAPVKRGTLYKDIVGGNQQISDTHPLLYFCRELQYQQSDQYVIWEWSSDEQAHSSYNADITYELEDAGFPVYTRVYTIRRDEYEQNPTIAIGSTLAALIGVTIVDGGQDYTYATGEIVGKGATVTFVVSDGVIISGVVTNEGSGVVSGDTITITGDGGNASVIPMVQPTSAVLTSQKKEELPPDNPWANEFVKVTRVYQTLPGPTIHSTQLHVDGVVVDVATTVKVASTIVSGETLVGTTWTITTKTQEDNDYIGKEIVITRQVPGNPIPYTKDDEDGVTVFGVRTLKDTTLITTSPPETISGSTWTKRNKEFLTTRLTIGEEASDLVSWEVIETRAIPGIEIDEISYPYGPNGRRVTAKQLVERAAYTRTANGTANANFASALLVDEKLEGVAGSKLVARKIGIYDEIPTAVNQQGLGYFVEYPYDGDPNFPRLTWRFQILRLSATTAADLSSCPISGFTGLKLVDQKTEEADQLIEVKVVRIFEVLPGKDIIKTVIDNDGDIVTETRTKVEASTITTTITTAGGVYTKTFEEPIGGAVAWKVVQVKATQDTLPSYQVEIPDLIPEEFRALLPTTTTETTVIGIASLPTIATGDLMRRETQIDYNTYRLTVRGRPGVTSGTLTNKETTTQYGGGDVNVTLTLALSGTQSLDEGLTYLSSEIKDLGNGLEVKTTRQLDDSVWPTLPSRLWDEKLREEYDETQQVVDSGTAEDSNPGVFAWVSEVKALDKWRSQKINTSKGTPQYVDVASALITYEFKPFKFPGLLTPTAYGYYVRSAFAELIQHKIRTWWLSSSTTPTVGIPGSGADVEVEEILPDNVVISTLNSIVTLAYSGMVLHDTITTFGVLVWPATTPSYATYLASWQGFEKVIAGTITPEREKDVWKIQTESVIMR